VPPLYSFLTDEEWTVMGEWYTDTDAKFFDHTGECNVPSMALIQGLVMGSAIRNIVQLGHFIGYSTLLIGFMMRRMNFARSVFSIDISPEASDYTRAWVARAGLQDYVEILVGDSADPAAAVAARSFFLAPPNLVFIDSSHGYQHTLDELKLWYHEVRPGGLVILHDASEFAARFDPRQEGGVARALRDWLRDASVPAVLLNADAPPAVAGDRLVYGDPCGLAILQKPLQDMDSPDRPAS
jgi:predicted O-methyltransferase YrrM